MLLGEALRYKADRKLQEGMEELVKGNRGAHSMSSLLEDVRLPQDAKVTNTPYHDETRFRNLGITVPNKEDALGLAFAILDILPPDPQYTWEKTWRGWYETRFLELVLRGAADILGVLTIYVQDETKKCRVEYYTEMRTRYVCDL